MHRIARLLIAALLLAIAPLSIAAQQPEPQKQQQQQNKAQTVYITRTGKKYHRDGCQYQRGSRIPIALKDAKGNYTPCSVCRPPQ
jgi:hypothetical protein